MLLSFRRVASNDPESNQVWLSYARPTTSSMQDARLPPCQYIVSAVHEPEVKGTLGRSWTDRISAAFGQWLHAG